MLNLRGEYYTTVKIKIPNELISLQAGAKIHLSEVVGETNCGQVVNLTEEIGKTLTVQL